jgi:hypothetical protein
VVTCCIKQTAFSFESKTVLVPGTHTADALLLIPGKSASSPRCVEQEQHSVITTSLSGVALCQMASCFAPWWLMPINTAVHSQQPHHTKPIKLVRTLTIMHLCYWRPRRDSFWAVRSLVTRRYGPARVDALDGVISPLCSVVQKQGAVRAATLVAERVPSHRSVSAVTQRQKACLHWDTMEAGEPC